MSTQEEELLFINKDNFSQSWLVELNQKLTFCIHRIADKVDIREDDYELLRALYRLHYGGDYMIFKTQGQLIDETAVQQGLFSSETPKVDPNDDLALDLTK